MACDLETWTACSGSLVMRAAAPAAADARDEHAQSVCCETTAPPTLHLRIIVAEPFTPQTCLLSMCAADVPTNIHASYAHVCRAPCRLRDLPVLCRLLELLATATRFHSPVAFSSSEEVSSHRLRCLAGAPASWRTKVLLHLCQPKWCPPTRSPNQLDRKASPFMCWSF